MIDTHTHLDDSKFDNNREQVLQRSFEGGIEKIINVGADWKGSQASVALADRHEKIYASVGLHPHVFNEANFSLDLERLEKLARNKKVVAIGEIGLDYFSHSEKSITEEQKENQKKGFIAQIELAQKLDLPVIVHCRASDSNLQTKDGDTEDAYMDCLEIIKQYAQVKFVFHCYGGDLDFTKKLLDSDNIAFSFTGNITYGKTGSQVEEIIKLIPIDKIMLETDCPYLTPVPHRGKINEPTNVVYVGRKIAEIRQISMEEVDNKTTENALRFFKM